MSSDVPTLSAKAPTIRHFRFPTKIAAHSLVRTDGPTRPDSSGRVRLGASDSIHGAVVQRVRTTRTESPGGAKAHTQTRAVVETHTHYSILCVRTRAGLVHGGANCKGYTKTGGLAL